MTDDPKNLKTDDEPKDPLTTDPAAEPKDPDSGNQEHMIPKSRLDQEIKKAADLGAENERLKAEKKAEVEKRLAEQENWEELATSRGEELAEANAKAEQVDAYEKTLKGVLAAQVEQIPEDLRGLIPEEMSTQQQLDWIAKNNSLLRKSQPFDIGAGKRGGEEVKGVTMTEEQKRAADKSGVSHEEYAKHIPKT